jgi:hypothetical protein
MKKIQFVLPLAFCLAACNQNAKTATEKPAPGTENTTAVKVSVAEAPIMTFTETRHDFGDMPEGEVVKYVFKFTNTGKSPLVIQNATGSCGCTIPQYPKEPVTPGASGEIQVMFNSRGKSGMQHKTVTIFANTQPDETKIEIQANVQKSVSEIKSPASNPQ